MITAFDRFFTEISGHARRAYPDESCGIISQGQYIEIDNIAADPRKDFKMPSDTMLKYQVQAVIHSHPDGKLCPSEADMQGQINTAVPWGICVISSGEAASRPFFWGDSLEPPPLVGREFRHGPSGSDGRGDCYALIRDWFRLKRGVMLPDFPRSDGWWNQGGHLYEDHFQDAGFKEIAASDARDGDVFFMRILSSEMNHAGILTGNSQLILHHMSGRLSREEPVGRWIKYIAKWVRYYDA